MTKTELDTLKSRVDLLDLAGKYTELHRESAREMAGPCPMPGCTAKTDGFHVHADGWWKCYTCHPKPGDAIEFVRWIKGCGFKEALAALNGDLPRITKPIAKPERCKPQSAGLPTWAASKVAAGQTALFDDPGAEPGRRYLLGRGLDPSTWMAFGLGYDAAAPLPGTEGKERRPAILIPWYKAGKLVAVRYRFLVAENGRKQSSILDSHFAGTLYGGQVIDRGAMGRTLVICEGELNAASIWQVANPTRLDVLSLGSESQAIPPGTIEYAKHYAHVIVWADKGEIADKLAKQLGVNRVESPGGKDANDLLQTGDLGGVLGALRLKMCQNEDDHIALYLDYRRALLAPGGADKGAASTFRTLAGILGINVDLEQTAPGWWQLV